MKNKALFIAASSLCFSLLVWLYGITHIDSILAAAGDFCYAKNDIAQAEKFYGTAFELGIKDSGRRIRYVNMIINSPLTVEAQEKLVKFINYPIEDEAKLKAEYFLYELRREIFRKYPENYIKKAVHNGKIIRWDTLPVTYGFKSDEKVPEYYVKEIEAAFLEWEKSLDHAIYFERVNTSPNITIDFQENNSAADENKKYFIAYTMSNINSENKLLNMRIVFYLKDIAGNYLPENQVYYTALHEISHALGMMGHSDNREDVMYMSKETPEVNEKKRIPLTTADINTMKLLYTIKPDITNSFGTKSTYIPYVVTGNDKEVINSKIREAKSYIKKAPNLPMGYIDLATGYVSAGDYAKAIKSLEKALQVAGGDEISEIIYYNLAVCYHNINNSEMALDYILKSIRIKDTETKRYLLAEIYTSEGKTDKAVGEYGALIKQHPKNTEYTIALTNIYVKNKEYLKARKVLKNYFISNPQDKKNPRLAPYGIIRLGL